MENDKWYLVDNELGLFLHAAREAKGYTMEEVCKGICSLATLFRIETGERVVDYILIEALLSRMKLLKSEYEFVLDEDDYSLYMERENIKKLIENENYEQAEAKLLRYEKKNGKDSLHRQFIFYQRAVLEQKKNEIKNDEIMTIFENAVYVTASDYKERIEQKEILSDIELFCVIGIYNCLESCSEREKKYRELYEYFAWCHIREKMFPTPYRSAMRYYAECLFELGKCTECIKICSEVLEELYETSKLENRNRIFELRARASEQLGFQTEEEKKQCIKDFLTAYYLTGFYEGKEQAEEIKRHLEEVYEWQFIE